MGTRYFALILGIFYLLIGVLGLIPGLITSGLEEQLTVDALSGNLLGIFPVNIVHTIVHLLIGIWGIMAYRNYDSARSYARAVGVIFLVLFVMGLIPGMNTMFGMAPLYGADVWLHLLTAITALYFGLAAPTAIDRTDRPIV